MFFTPRFVVRSGQVYRALRINSPDKLRSAVALAASRQATHPHLMALATVVKTQLKRLPPNVGADPLADPELDLALFTVQASGQLADHITELMRQRHGHEENEILLQRLASALQPGVDHTVTTDNLLAVADEMVAKQEDFLVRSRQWLAAEDELALAAAGSQVTDDGGDDRQPGMLLKAIHHFQLLFNVGSVAGVIPCMSRVHGAGSSSKSTDPFHFAPLF